MRDLLLMGKSGLGKTFLMQCIAHRVAERGYLPTYVSAYRFFETARQAYMDNDGARLRPLMEAELLLIDDLGTELVTRYTQAEVYDLVTHRLNTGKPTIINTNLGLQEIERTYSSRVYSRLAGMYAAVQFKGRDIRLQKKQEGYR